jgi:hypothetical protein
MVIQGVDFPDKVAVRVERLITALFAKIGPSYCYPSGNQIRFALVPPREARMGKAFRIFIQIKSLKGEAVLRRPLPPKVGKSLLTLTDDNHDEALSLCLSWFDQVKGAKIPIGCQSTENSRIFAGGQFESKRSAH